MIKMGKEFEIEWKQVIPAIILGILIGFFGLSQLLKEQPVPPRVEFITTDPNHCTAEYTKTEICSDIRVCSMNSQQGNFGMEYYCKCW